MSEEIENTPAPAWATLNWFDRAVFVLNAFGSLWVLLIVVLICLDSFGRSLFNEPLNGVNELVAVSMAFIVFCQMPDTVRLNKLTRSDTYLPRMQASRRLLARLAVSGIDILGMAVMLGIVSGTVRLLHRRAGHLHHPRMADPRHGRARQHRHHAVFHHPRRAPLARVRARPGLTAPPMEPVVIGILSLVLIVLMIYGGCYVAITLSFVSFLGVWIIKSDATIAMRMMTLSVTATIRHYDYASIPTFVMMGMIVGKTGFGSDIYQVANQLFRRLRGGLGIATVAASAAFAAVTGSSIAAASVFTRVSVPEMIRFDYSKRFAVGVVAGSSVLGMIIPPSVMMIIYAFIAEQSVGDMFLAGVIPGLLLSCAYIVSITAMTRFAPDFIGKGAFATPMEDHELLSPLEILVKIAPIVVLIVIVLGGIYTGFFDAAEAGAIGAFFAYLLALLRRRIGWKIFREVLIDTGHITANILFLIISASMYSRMLGIAGLPFMLSQWLEHINLGFGAMMAFYVVLLLFLGTIIDTGSIILVCVPLFLHAIESMGLNLVWFGLITVVGAEIGLLTPPFGLSCFVIKTAIDRSDITLNDIFFGAFPFAVVMLAVLIILIAFPQLSLMLL